MAVWFRVLFLGVVALSLFLSGCEITKKEASSTPVPKVDGNAVTLVPGSKQIDQISVEPCLADDKAVIPITGHITWDDDVTVRIYTPVSGKVVKIVGNLGQKVDTGTPLLYIDSPDFGQSQSDALKAQSDVNLAEKVLARDQDLLLHGAAAQKDVEGDAADLVSKKAELQRALAQLSHFGGTLGQINNQYVLKSPISGTIVEKNINPGQQLRDDLILSNIPQGYQPLFVVSDPSKLWLFLDVSEEEESKLHQGQKLVLHSRAFPEKTFHGAIEDIGQALDPTTRTLKVRALVDNSELILRSEMYVTAELNDIPSGGVTIPAQAPLRKNEKTYVFVERAPGDYERREITTGSEYQGRIAVAKGLSMGERIVINGGILLENIIDGKGNSN